MIDTKTIRTQQEIIAKRNMALPKKWILGIDAGFSSLKGFAPNKYFCFPSFAHKLDSELQVVNEKDILYRDESGTYLVGIYTERISGFLQCRSSLRKDMLTFWMKRPCSRSPYRSLLWLKGRARWYSRRQWLP